MSISHSFCVKLATKIGLKEAILLSNLYFWCKKNKGNNKHFYNGKWWTYNSVKAYSEYFEYMSDGEIRGAMNRLYEDGYVVRGNFNETKYDRTSWYAITEKGLSELISDKDELKTWFSLDNIAICEINKSICEINKSICEINEPIPYNNTNNNTNNPTTTEPKIENQILKAFGLSTIKASEKFRDCKNVIDSLLQFQSNSIGKLRQQGNISDAELKEQAIEDIEKGYFKETPLLRAKELQNYFQEELKDPEFIEKLSKAFYELQLKNFRQKNEFMFIGNINPPVLKAIINKSINATKSENEGDFSNNSFQSIHNLINEIKSELKEAPEDYYENPYLPASIEFMEHNNKVHLKYKIKNYSFVLDYVLKNKPPCGEAGVPKSEFIEKYKYSFIKMHGESSVYSLWCLYERLIENEVKFFPEVDKVFNY